MKIVKEDFEFLGPDHLEKQKASEGQILDEFHDAGGTFPAIVGKTRLLIGSAVLAGMMAGSTAQADEKKNPNQTALHGSVGAGVQYLSTTYRKGNSLNIRLNGPELGPLKSFAKVTIGGMSANNGLLPSTELGMETGLKILPGQNKEPAYLALNASMILGCQYVISQLDYPKATDVQLWPYATAGLSLPVTLPFNHEKKTYWTFAPGVSFTEYLLADDMKLKVPDGAGGVKEIVAPRHNQVLSLSTGILFRNEGTFLGASLNYDPLDPTVKEGAVSMWGALNFSKSF